ncbi:MAG: DUF438 domain-containing protein [Methanomassiliicoccales archaeon]|jgi:DUF438 domain-containing protein|nr:DUF438 domain-containing protein [Methanomassiliicoccales archaeon]
MSGQSNEAKKIVKEIIEDLKRGKKVAEVKERFKQVLSKVDRGDITIIEDALVKEGVPIEDVKRLCEVHVAVSREISDERPMVGPGHPIFILLEEHKYVKDVADEISRLLPSLLKENEVEETVRRLREIVEHLKEYNKHKVREENALFPMIEKHGVTQPPAVMWSEHDQQRALIKEIAALLNQNDVSSLDTQKLASALRSISEMVMAHFYKEENILFPTALKLINETEWKQIKESMDDLGYCYFTPSQAIGTVEGAVAVREVKGAEITLETGTLTLEQLEAIFAHLPIDITFVDDKDSVRFFNQTRERIFPRTKAIIGRKVQKCHPQKSVEIVERILNDFRAGARDSAKFWIHLGDRYVLIQYFAVRGKDNRYLGCLEVTQDIAPIKKIEGEKRLLD